MAINNPRALLDAATALPAAIEAKLPAGAPKLSTNLLEINSKLPTLPDFPVSLPDLPAIPEIPGLPELPGSPTLGRRYVNAVEIRPVPLVTREAPIPTPRVTQVVKGEKIIEGRGF